MQLPSELSNVVIAAIIIVVAIFLSWLTGVVLDFFVRRFSSRTSTKFDDVIIQAVKGPVRIAILVAGFQLALKQIQFIPETWREPINDFFFVVYLMLVFFACYRLIGGISGWYAKEVVHETETDLDDKFLSLFRALANTILVFIAIIILLGHFGIEPSALITTLGIGTLAVALAAQETLSDFIAGFMIMLDQPFSIGDRVAIQDINTWGDITDIGLRSTRILTRDNRMVTVPNSVIGKGLVVNYSDPSTVFRVETHIGVGYGTDVDEARRIMVEALGSEGWVMHDRPVEALLLEFGESALVFRVRCWIEHYMETRRVMDKMNSALYKALNQAAIKIPNPQREVRLLEARVSPESGVESLPKPG